MSDTQLYSFLKLIFVLSFAYQSYFFRLFFFFKVLSKLKILPFKSIFRVLNVTIFRLPMLLFIVLYFLLFYPFLGFTVFLFSLNYFYLLPQFQTQMYSRSLFFLFFKQFCIHSALNRMFTLNVLFSNFNIFILNVSSQATYRSFNTYFNFLLIFPSSGIIFIETIILFDLSKSFFL